MGPLEEPLEEPLHARPTTIAEITCRAGTTIVRRSILGDFSALAVRFASLQAIRRAVGCQRG